MVYAFSPVIDSPVCHTAMPSQRMSLRFGNKALPLTNSPTPTHHKAILRSSDRFDIFCCANTKRRGSIDDPLHSLLIRPEHKRGWEVQGTEEKITWKERAEEKALWLIKKTQLRCFPSGTEVGTL